MVDTLKIQFDGWIESMLEKVDPPFDPEGREKIKALLMDLVNTGLEIRKEGLPSEEELRDSIDKLIEDSKGSFNEGELKKARELCENVLIKGSSLSEAMGITKENIEWFYMEGFKLFKAGKYQDALSYFKFLLFLSPATVRFAFSASACYHQMKNYEQAINGYFFCAMKDQESPLPYYHMADCYIAQGEHSKGYKVMALAVNRCKKHPEEFKILGDRAQLIMEKLKQDNKVTTGS